MTGTRAALAPRRLAEAHRCLNFRLRQASRLLSQHYDAALRSTGLRGTQFSLLVILAGSVELPISRVAMAMGMERSALARNLRPLERQGLVRIAIGPDRRTRIASLTESGARALARALPSWRRAQRRLLARLSKRKLQDLEGGLRAAIVAVGSRV